MTLLGIFKKVLGANRQWSVAGWLSDSFSL